jgi:hypothetical protein
MLRWLRSWRERDDRHLVKPGLPANVDPVEELMRIVSARIGTPTTNAVSIAYPG